MRRKSFLNRGVAAILLLALSGCARLPRTARRPAELVFRNGVIYARGGSSSEVQALAASNGRVVFAGSNPEAASWIGPATRVLDLKGRTVLPGFHDSHAHPALGGVQLGECRLTGLDSPEKVYAAIRRYAAENPRPGWVRGNGWDLPVFPDANPQKADLDRLIPDRPAYFISADLHSAWVNSRALKEAGITKDTKDPPGGKIERDPKTGEPSGTLRDPAGYNLVASRIPPYSSQDYEEGVRRALRLANSLGITSLHEAWGTKEVVAALRSLDARGELTAKVAVSIFADPEQGLSQLPSLLKAVRETQGKRLKARSVKVFLDGVIEARTAAMLEPYEDKPGERGALNWKPEVFDALVAGLDRNGVQVHVHAIGDRAARTALDAFERARAANGPRDNRHEIAHLEVVEPEDIPRFRKLGVWANVQPLWAYADDYINKLTLPGLGPRRSEWIYPIGSLLKAEARLACGSDWPVSSMNPLEAMQVAVTRRDPQAPPGPAWLPQHLVNLGDMVSCYTTGGAYVDFQEKETGALTPGLAADLIVLDRDIFNIPAQEIHRAKVLMTLLGGQVVYQDSSL